MSFETKFELLDRRLHREKAARIAAEEILTFKSIELYKANQDLIDLNKILEKENLSRTDDLVKSRLMYEQLVESASHIIYEVDAQGYVLFANQITERILQKSREDLIGINVIDLIADSHKEEIRNTFYRSIQNKEAMRYDEFPCLRKDGEIVWLSQNFHNDFEIIAGQKIFKGGKGVARDITSQFYENLQLERNEIKYRNVMENMDLGYIEVDLDGRILKAYDKFLKMTGYSKEDLIGNIAEEILLPEEYRGLMKTQNDARIKGQMGSYEVEMIAKNGERLWTLISGGPILDEKGNVIGSVGIHYDLTQQKAVQKDLLLAKKEAENAQKAEQDFLANMSHEIRTPLNAIIGISHLLYDTNPSAEQLEYFTSIKNSANFLHTLISDVLDMAKIDAGKIQPKNEPFDLLSLLDTLQKTFELKIGKKELKIITITDDRISDLIKGDETLLNQVLLNLVGNAEKFTEKGSIIIKTDLIEEKKDKLFIKFSIKDTGIGIPQDDLEIIFQKFRQVSSKQQSKTRGTGLGLSIVKELVKSMQGKEMEVRSNKGEGTEFSFVLPFTKTNIKRGSQLKILETESINFSRKRILLVEDNSLNTLYATKLLKRWDIEVTHAKDGLEAVEMIHKHYFDLILMDIQMPNLNGYEATIQIRNTININKVIPIIALTATASPDDQIKAIEVGMNSVLTKPFTPIEMQLTLEKFLKSINNQEVSLSMNKKPEASINEERLNEIYGGDNEFKKMVFETFLEEIPSQIAEIRYFVKNKNWTELAKVAHKIKPALGMVGLTSGEEDLRIIETTIKTEGINKQLVELITAFIENCDPYVNRIKEELKKIS